MPENIKDSDVKNAEHNFIHHSNHTTPEVIHHNQSVRNMTRDMQPIITMSIHKNKIPKENISQITTGLPASQQDYAGANIAHARDPQPTVFSNTINEESSYVLNGTANSCITSHIKPRVSNTTLNDNITNMATIVGSTIKMKFEGPGYTTSTPKSMVLSYTTVDNVVIPTT